VTGAAAQSRAILPPELMDRLSTMQMVAHAARATRGTGERLSRASGPGIEFAEFRPYRAGDDLRLVDPRSLAQGAPLTRNYVQRRQLMVTIVLDLTLSMLAPAEGKANLAVGLAQALGFVALSGQDRVRLLVLGQQRKIERSPVWQGRSSAPDLFAFARTTAGPAHRDPLGAPAREATSLTQAVAELVAALDQGSVVIVISDFWDADAAIALSRLAATPASLVALQVLTALEQDPSGLGEGVHRLVDAETGAERDFAINDNLLRQYRSALADHTAALVAAASDRNLFLTVPAEQSLGAVCLELLPSAGVIQ